MSFGGQVEERLYKLSEKGDGTDVELKLDKSTIVLHAHSVILSAESKVLKAMLEKAKKKPPAGTDNVKIVLKLQDPEEHFQNFLKALYGFEISDLRLAIPTLKLAIKYQAERLEKACDELLKNQVFDYNDPLFTANSVELLGLAGEVKYSEVVESVLDYVRRNLWMYWKLKDKEIRQEWSQEVVIKILGFNGLEFLRERPHNATYWSRNEVALFKYAIKWLKFQKKLNQEKRNNALAVQVLEKIRFCQMSSRDFGKCMKRVRGFLTTDQIERIALRCSGASEAQIAPAPEAKYNFVVDTRLRKRNSQQPGADESGEA